MKRKIKLIGTDIELEITKVTAIKLKKNMIHLDQLDDGSWRLIYNSNMIPDFTKIDSFEIIRE